MYNNGRGEGGGDKMDVKLYSKGGGGGGGGKMD